MISEDEIMDFLSQILALEEKMQTSYNYLAKSVHTKKYRNQFEQLSSEEASHADIAKVLIRKLSEHKIKP